MIKLTQQEANDLLIQAINQKQEYPMLRLGQSIWILIPNQRLQHYIINDYFYDPDVDFFNETDDNIALDKFYKYFVEEL